jgi:hypothetical protein
VHSSGQGSADTPTESSPDQVEHVPASPEEREPGWWVLVLRAVYAPFARYVDRVQDEERAYRRRHDTEV